MISISTRLHGNIMLQLQSLLNSEPFCKVGLWSTHNQFASQTVSVPQKWSTNQQRVKKTSPLLTSSSMEEPLPCAWCLKRPAPAGRRMLSPSHNGVRWKRNKEVAFQSFILKMEPCSPKVSQPLSALQKWMDSTLRIHYLPIDAIIPLMLLPRLTTLYSIPSRLQKRKKKKPLKKFWWKPTQPSWRKSNQASEKWHGWPEKSSPLLTSGLVPGTSIALLTRSIHCSPNFLRFSRCVQMFADGGKLSDGKTESGCPSDLIQLTE